MAENYRQLVKALAVLERKSNQEWMASLEERKVAEAEFHDKSHSQHSSTEGTYTNSKFYAVAGSSDDYYYGWVDKHAPGRVVLDYACGNGGGAIRAAEAGAKLTIGLDISRQSIENAKKAAKEKNLDNVIFVQGDCERTTFPDECVDYILCAGMLHHIDLSYAFPEMHRILRPGGTVLANEALSYNPFIKLYRKLTPQLRTEFEAEHIISHKDLRFAARFFEIRDIRYWHLCSLMAVPLRKTALFRPALAVLKAIDSTLLRIPLVQNMAWQFTFELSKKE